MKPVCAWSTSGEPRKQDRSPGQDSKARSLLYEAGALTSQPQRRQISEVVC